MSIEAPPCISLMSKHFDWWHDDAKQFLGCHERIDEQILALVLILGAEERIKKNIHFLAHVHCRVQLRYLSELVGCDMLWSPTNYTDCQREAVLGSNNCPSSRNRTPLSRRRSQNMCFGYVRLIFSDQTQDCTKKSSVLLRLIYGWRVSNLAAPTHTPNLQQRYKTLHEPTQSSSFAISAANIPKLTKKMKIGMYTCGEIVFVLASKHFGGFRMVFAETDGCPELLTARLVHGKWPWSDSWVKGMGLIGFG